MRHRIGFAWYRPEDWQRLLDISDDRDKMENTYEEWLDQAEESFRKARDAGIDVIKIYINLDELTAWCAENNLEINSYSRSNFVTHKLQQLFSE